LDVDLKPRNTSWLKKADLIFVVGLPLLSLLVLFLLRSIGL
jgi:hypothetical protein